MERSVQDLFQNEMSGCRKCSAILSRTLVDPSASQETVQPRPIIPCFRQQPILLIGQAPGLSEYQTGQPFEGPAGKGIRRILAEVGVTSELFDDLVYSTAIVKCFPGSKIDRGQRRDEIPCSQMTHNCLSFLRRQFELYRPQVAITLGGFALEYYKKMRGQPKPGNLGQFVGQMEVWQETNTDVVFFPHTSGSSRWLNDPGNRQSLQNAIHRLRLSLVQRSLVS